MSRGIVGLKGFSRGNPVRGATICLLKIPRNISVISVLNHRARSTASEIATVSADSVDLETLLIFLEYESK